MSATIAEILRTTKTIAVVGVSDRPDRPSYGVAEYLQRYYTIVPINPKLETWNGLRCYPSLTAVPESVHIDLVDVFRKASDVPAVFEDMAQRKEVRCLWLQLGISHEAVANRARELGIEVIMDACIAVEHARYRPRE